METKEESQLEITPAETGSEAAKKSATLREYLESLVVTVILALFGTTFIIQAFKIPSSSMEDTLLIGDHLMVDKLAYAPRDRFASLFLPYQEIQHRDIIVFKYPVDPGTHFVKRIIGVPGDRVFLRHKNLYVNGHLQDEGYVVHKMPTLDEYRDNFPAYAPLTATPPWPDELPNYVRKGELVAPPGRYFAMGDNRDFSSDSRYWGFVPRQNIVGRPVIIYWSLDSTSADYRYSSGWERIVGIGKTIIEFPLKTRWGRMFLLIRPRGD